MLQLPNYNIKGLCIMAKQPDELNLQEESFVLLIFQGHSQIDAYRTAFPKAAKWKDTTVSPKASTLLKSDKIQARLTELREQVQEATGITAERVLKELEHMAFSNIQELFDGHSLKEISELPENVARSIAEINVHRLKADDSDGKSQNVAEIVKLKQYSKLDAIEKIAKHLGLYEKDNKQRSLDVDTLANRLLGKGE